MVSQEELDELEREILISWDAFGNEGIFTLKIADNVFDHLIRMTGDMYQVNVGRFYVWLAAAGNLVVLIDLGPTKGKEIVGYLLPVRDSRKHPNEQPT